VESIISYGFKSKNKRIHYLFISLVIELIVTAWGRLFIFILSVGVILAAYFVINLFINHLNVYIVILFMYYV
jgi:hypothetical protein